MDCATQSFIPRHLPKSLPSCDEGTVILVTTTQLPERMLSKPTFLPQHRLRKIENILLCIQAKVHESPAGQQFPAKSPSWEMFI